MKHNLTVRRRWQPYFVALMVGEPKGLVVEGRQVDQNARQSDTPVFRTDGD